MTATQHSPDRLEMAFEANRRRARDLVRGLARSQLNWNERGGWSVAQCLDHLAQSNTQVGNAIAATLAGASSGDRPSSSGRILPHWLAWFFVRLLEPPYRLKFQAPEAVRPESREWGDEVLNTYLASHDNLLSAIRAGSYTDLKRTYFRHPVQPFRLAIRDGLELMAAHDRRHLWQAEQVGRKFPR